MTERELLHHSMKELEAQVEKHRRLIESVIESRPLEQTCIWNDCHHQQMLLSLLVETVQVLEGTKKSFKSKQLEKLRKRLLHVLTNETNCGQAQQKIVTLGLQHN